MFDRFAAVTPFDRILEIAQHARTLRARELMRPIRDEIEGPADVPRWAHAIQLARDVGALGAAECHALLDIVTESAMGALTQTDVELRRLDDAMRMIATADGLSEDEDYYVDDAPAEWLALNRQWDHRFDQLHADLFRRIGEPGMADELLLRQKTFAVHSADGRAALFDISEEGDIV
jgi:hypothetical protein